VPKETEPPPPAPQDKFPAPSFVKTPVASARASKVETFEIDDKVSAPIMNDVPVIAPASRVPVVVKLLAPISQFPVAVEVPSFFQYGLKSISADSSALPFVRYYLPNVIGLLLNVSNHPL